ncbi:MAG: glycosyltransferase family 2 protein [Scytolyngbya sp. HA4215-MV1]|nr:glycosyltransferase family 2 protein [Scytolyngbya sp. HA4215-MV1]
MPENSWPENGSRNELESLSSLLVDLSDLSDSEDPGNQPFHGMEGRRRKAAMVLAMIWSGTIVLHLLSWGYWLVLGLTTLMGIHAVRILLARPLPLPEPLDTCNSDPETLPFVSLLVAAKNEEAVIGRLVKMLCELDYPSSRYELWVIDDNSTDRTGILLDQMKEQYRQLHVFHRGAGASGGKSGALNQVLPLTQGDIIAVFDADAQVTDDLLKRVLPVFDRPQIGAIQVRKSVLAYLHPNNFWLQGQVAEMALDTYIQRQRVTIGGIGELRGNGQFVRRTALNQCGGWNEETITDDLDLTLRLHLHRWDIDVMTVPAVEEEGITKAVALWHQRNRWIEGGYQRYLDYWRPLMRNRMGTRKTLDMMMFYITQYLLPTAAIPDFFMAIVRNRPMLFSPIAELTIFLSLVGMFTGLRQVKAAQASLPQEKRVLSDRDRWQSIGVTLLQTLLGIVYMLHWIPIVSSTTARMSIRPKRLKWVKTIHHGTGDVWLDVTEQPE